MAFQKGRVCALLYPHSDINVAVLENNMIKFKQLSLRKQKELVLVINMISLLHKYTYVGICAFRALNLLFSRSTQLIWFSSIAF